MPDHCPRLAGPARRAAAVELARGVDVLLHGGPFLDSEQATADAYGHATVADAIALAAEADARRLVLIHHAPGRTDRAVAEIEAALTDAPVPTSIGREDDWGRGEQSAAIRALTSCSRPWALTPHRRSTQVDDDRRSAGGART